MKVGEKNEALVKLIKAKYGTQKRFSRNFGENKMMDVNTIIMNKRSIRKEELRLWAKYLGLPQKKILEIIETGKI